MSRNVEITSSERGIQLTAVETQVQTFETYGEAISNRRRKGRIKSAITLAEAPAFLGTTIYVGITLLEVMNEQFLRGEGLELGKLIAGGVVGATGMILARDMGRNFNDAFDAFDETDKLQAARNNEIRAYLKNPSVQPPRTLANTEL